MKILIAPDSFKGSLSSAQVCAVLQAGLMAGDPSLTIETLPMADGGGIPWIAC